MEVNKKLDANFNAPDQQIHANYKEIFDNLKIQISKVSQIATLALISATIVAVIGLIMLLMK